MSDRHATSRLLVACPDQKGLVAAITGFLAERGGNILDLDQHTDLDAAMFFLRVVIDPDGFTVTPEEFEHQWREVADRLQMSWRVHSTAHRRRVGVLVGKTDHCLRELLWRWKDGELDCELRFVAGNHDRHRSLVERYGVPFVHCPKSQNARAEPERHILDLVEEHEVDTLILARYMQILSPDFVNRMPNRIINIHHSFLPAFSGAMPYHQAHLRGVKLIGATCHYVTAELDAGPIIEQAVARVGHHDTIDDLVRKGRDLERSALLTGLRLHLDDRILVYGNRTVVFH